MQENTTPVESKDWFKVWFDSPYYYTLYKDRNDDEAELFVDRLLEYLSPKPEAVILDLACGRGRYSRYLASLGYTVVGLDISPKSIEFARQYEQSNLTFYTHDMRQVFRTNYFDCILNIFTSFGYFENEKDHIRTLKTVAAGLKPEGLFVLDFFNAKKIVRSLPKEEEKTVDKVGFKIKKWIVKGTIYKSIQFKDKGAAHQFTERVKAYELPDFKRMFDKAGLRMVDTFGDYFLQPFDENTSDRLIIIGTLKAPTVVYGQD